MSCGARGAYLETAQIFRFMRSKPRVLSPSNSRRTSHVTPGCSFALGERGTCKVGDFTLLNGALLTFG